jgi:biliverdin reductase/flavin reductase
VKIVLFGATGGTGHELLQQALDRGHEVTVIARHPMAVTLTHARLQVVSGDVLQPDSFALTLQGKDAVLSTLGRNSLKPMTFYRQSAYHLVEQMAQAGVPRLVCLTSVGAAANPMGPLLYRWLLKPLLRNIYDDMRHMEQTIRASALAWTIVRPSRLFDGKRIGQYRVGASGELARANKISRADVANCMLNQLDTQANWHQTVAVAY